MAKSIDCESFISVARPLIEADDRAMLVETLNARWTPAQISRLLTDASADCRKFAAVCLSLVATAADADSIAVGLHDTDPAVVRFTEHALWSVWFRAGSPAANAEVCRGAKAICRREFTTAIRHFDAAIESSPRFAEAYNQRAIVHYLEDRHEQSIADCRRAFRLMPCHFGAMAGMGHCFLHLGQLPEALSAYDRAIAIHPGLEGVVQTAARIREKLAMVV